MPASHHKGNRILIVGLDGATWTVLEPLIAKGLMPTLARLRESGCWGELTSTVPHITAPAWTTFMTGKNPGKHGVFHFIDLDDEPQSTDSGTRPLVDARSIHAATLWDILSHHGRRVGVVNLPMTYPPHAVNGFMVTGLLTPPGAKLFTYPPELGGELGNYRIEIDRFADRTPFARPGGHEAVSPSASLMDEFLRLLEEHAEAWERLMAEQPWDVFMAVFAEPDRMGHYLWPHLITNGSNGSAESNEIHSRVIQYFRRLDQAIEAMVRLAGPDAAVFVISDHGMGPAPSRRVHWNTWLAEKGLLVPKAPRQGEASLDTWLRRLRLPRDVLGKVAQAIPGFKTSGLARSARRKPGLAIDAQCSQVVYETLYNNVGGFRINRSALGPGTSEEIERRAEELRRQLIAEAYSLLDPRTGKPVVAHAGPRESYFSGEHVSGMPDVIVELDPRYSGSTRVSYYRAPITDVLDNRTPGAHWQAGIFIASGQDILKAGRLSAVPHLADIAPTVLHLAGCPVPQDMDGHVLMDIVMPETLAGHPVEAGVSSDSWFKGREYVTDSLTKDEQAQVMKRLADLGYMST